MKNKNNDLRLKETKNKIM